MNPKIVSLVKATATKIVNISREPTFGKTAVPTVENELISFLTHAEKLDAEASKEGN